jgi:hypothetical protein
MRTLNGGVAVRITQDGQVLGGLDAAFGLLHAIRWDQRLRRSELGPLPALTDPEDGWQNLEGANDRGQFIGRLAAYGDDESAGHLAQWSPVVSVRAKAVSGRTRLRVNVTPNRARSPGRSPSRSDAPTAGGAQ